MKKGGGAYLKIYKPEGRCNASGIRVKEARELAGLSQEQLAAKIQLAGLSITQKAVSRIETGSRVVADYELAYLADALGVTINYLLDKE
nr:MAG TPA: helix-turn-helix domain protein [Caudoviricetes sp.]